MDSHSIAEMTSGLASRVNNLAILATGDQSRQLLAQQDELAKLAMAAIVKDLNSERADYKSAVAALEAAIQFVGKADKQISNIANAISLVAKALTEVGKVIAG